CGYDYITAIGVASGGKRMYVGAASGIVVASNDGGSSFGNAATDVPPRWGSGFAIDPDDDAEGYAAVSRFSATTSSAPRPFFHTTDGGGTWTRVDASLDPMDIPINAIAGHPLASNLFYIGTDVGVLVTWDGGNRFYPLANGMPNVAVFSLAFNAKSTSLVAG